MGNVNQFFGPGMPIKETKIEPKVSYKPSSNRQSAQEPISIPASSLAGLGSKNVQDGMSRKSTAMSNNLNSDMGTPGDYKRLSSGQNIRKESKTKLKNSNTQN